MQESKMSTFWNSSTLASGNSAYLESMYELYLKDPEQLDATWKSYFDKLNNGARTNEVSHAEIQNQFINLTKSASKPSFGQMHTVSVDHELKQIQDQH